MSFPALLKFLSKLFSNDTIDQFIVDGVIDMIDNSIKNPESQARYEHVLKAIAHRINQQFPPTT